MDMTNFDVVETNQNQTSNKPGVAYTDIRGQIESLDLIMFRGSDLVSKAIIGIESRVDKTDAQFSHVGIAIRAEHLMPALKESEAAWLKPGNLYVFESTGSGSLSDNVKNVDGRSFLGVQLRNLDEVARAYDAASEDTRLALLPLKPELRPAQLATVVRAAYDKYNGIFYDASVVDMAAAACRCMRCVRDCGCFQRMRDWFYKCCCGPCCHTLPSGWMFCSELVANIYRDVGILPEGDPQNVIPQDFVPTPNGTKTYDSDHNVPVLFGPLVRFHCP